MAKACKYCRRVFGDGGCKSAADANACQNAHPDVLYQDRKRSIFQFNEGETRRERTSTEGGMGKWTVHEWPERGEGW